jgi:hypothetical protein
MAGGAIDLLPSRLARDPRSALRSLTEVPCELPVTASSSAPLANTRCALIALCGFRLGVSGFFASVAIGFGAYID